MPDENGAEKGACAKNSNGAKLERCLCEKLFR